MLVPGPLEIRVIGRAVEDRWIRNRLPRGIERLQQLGREVRAVAGEAAGVTGSFYLAGFVRERWSA